MGYIKHNALIVTDWDDKDLKIAHEKAIEIYKETINDSDVLGWSGEQLISPIIQGLTNGQASFFIAPDGSKEGWDTSDKSDEARTKFMDWMKESGKSMDYVELRFGGDDESCSITRDKDSDMN